MVGKQPGMPLVFWAVLSYTVIMKTKLDNKVFIFLGGLVDIIWISLLWYLGSLLLITLLASCVAMYYTVHMRIFKGEGYIFPVFKKAFLDNFKKATILWLICLILDAFLVFDFILARMAISQGSALAVFYYPVLVCGILAFMWQLSIVAYQARFDDTVRGVLVKAAAVAASNMGWMVFLAVILFGAIILCRYLIFLVIILPGGYACLMHHVFEHIYIKRGWIEAEQKAEDDRKASNP